MKQRCIEQLGMTETNSLCSGNNLQVSVKKNASKFISWQLLIALGITGTLTLVGSSALAQSNIVPDNTLGVGENSQVIPNFNGLPIEAITGGAQRGQNLFHSFAEFNVAVGRGAYFLPDAAIENILARVTGVNPSEILGTLGTIGGSQPNLFLINPNGIIFGENSKLDVGGSFVATTANAVGLGDTGRFSASEPDSSNLLDINPDVLFYNRLSNQAEIVNRSTAIFPVLFFSFNGLPLDFGLQVAEGESLLLLGGDVRLEGGRLRAPGGRVDLGGLSAPGTVGLNADSGNLSLSFPDDVARADVSLTNGAQMRTIAGGNGSIAINAQTVDILGESVLFAGIEPGNGSVDSKAGDIEINATETVGVRIIAADRVRFDGVGSNGLSSGAFSAVEAEAVGDGRDLEITTGSLEVTNGAILSASTSGQGNAGGVKINATDRVRFDGVGSNGTSSGAFSAVEAGAIGNGSDLEITTGSVEVTNGAILSASTSGQGNAGGVRIRANDTVRFDGVGSNQQSSGAFSSVEAGAVGNGSDLEITTGSVEVTNGAILSASTSGQGNAGGVRIIAAERVLFDGVGNNGTSSGAFSSVEASAVGNGSDLEINTGSLEVTNGAQLSARTSGKGDAGGVRIRATDTVRFDGVGSNQQSSGAFSGVAAGAVGDGKDIEITAGSLSLTDASITSESQGNGTAGNITINTRHNLETNRSSISATTLSGDGGNITLGVGDLLLMRDNSKISTSAGVAGAGGDGGDITIGADFVVGVSRENSDITANAFNGSGGNITITTQAIFGLQFRDRLTPLSDITASSEFGLDGTFILNLLFPIDVTQGLVDLPSNLVDATKLIDRRCTPGDSFRQSSFYITGRGGIPQNPTEMLDADATVSNWVTLDSFEENGDDTNSNTNPTSSNSQQIIEAQGIVRTPDGQLYLAAEVPTVTPHGQWIPAVDCYTFRN